MDNLKVISLEAENVKRLRAVNLTFDGTLQVIGGDNGEGKSSVLDSIWLAIGGGKATKDTQTSRPIHDGEDTATATVDLGEIIVTRTWKTGKPSTVKVTTPEGAEHKSPQAILDKLTANVGIDPLAFTLLSAKDQVKELLGLVDLPFVPAVLDAEFKEVFDQRTTVNKQVKDIDARLREYPKPAPDLPAEEVSVSALMDEFRTADARISAHSNALDNLRETDAYIQHLEDQLAEAREGRKGAVDRVAQTEELARPYDLQEIRNRMDSAEETNRAVRREKDRQKGVAALAKVQADAARLSARLEEIQDTRAHGLANAKWPITGLGFDADGLTYNKVPFKQASSAEQIRVSMAMAMAMNPSLRTLFIRDGSLLDGKNMRLVAELAAQHGFQIIMERVGTTDPGAIVIEDGRVSA